MKRLMVAIAAVASAFGLYAADEPISSTSFEAGDVEVFDGDGNLTVQSPWSSADPDAKLTKGQYNEKDVAYSYPEGNNRYSTFGNVQANYLNVKTALDKPVARAQAVTVGNEAVYFDQLVKFTAADEDISVEGTGAKIAFYVKDLTEAEIPAAETNLYVVAGKYVNNVHSVETYDLGPIDVDAWHRLTVKMMKGYAGDDLAFEAFLDGRALELGAPAIDAASTSGMSDTARAVNTAKRLFPSLVTGSLAVSGLALAGQGAIDDVMATTEVPGICEEDKDVVVAWDDNVTGFTYQVGSDDPVELKDLTKAGSFPIAYSAQFNVTISNVTCGDNWGFKTVDCEGACSYDAGVITFTGTPATATIASKDTTPRMVVLDDQGQPTTETYPNFKEALAGVGDGKTIRLALDVDVNTMLDADGVITEAYIRNKDVTIDLNGKKIVGKAKGFEGNVITVDGGSLTIIDSSANQGSIEAAETAEYVNIIGVFNKGSLAVSAGIIEGAVDVDAEDESKSSISGGKFLKGEETEFPLTLATGFKAELAGTPPDYWVISEKSKFTVTITKTNAKVKVLAGATPVAPGDEVYADTVLTISAEADQYYGNLTLKVDGKDFTSGDTLTVADNVEIVATATAVEYTLTYTEDAEVDPFTKKVKFTEANYTELELWDGEREDYTFNHDWYNADTLDEVGGTEALLANIKALIDDGAESLDLTLIGSWTPAVTKYTVTLSYDTTQIATVAATVDDEPATIDANAFTADAGAAIVITATAQDGYENVKFTVGAGQAADTCEFTLTDNTTVTIAGSKKAEPVLPDEPIPVPPEYNTPEEYAAAINAGIVPKADLLKAPYGDTTSSDYLDCFDAVAAAGDKVKFELNEDGATKLETIEENTLKTFTADSTKLEVQDPIEGFYYSLKQSTALESLDYGAQINKQANEATFDLTKPDGATAGFYQIVITPTAVEAE